MLRPRSEEEIELMRHAGRILGKLHEELKKAVRPGVSGSELDRLAYEFITGHDGCTPGFLGYEGYEYSICLSIDDVIVHGLPTADVILREGSIVSIDAGVVYKGYNSDAARTWPVGEVSREKEELMRVTRQAFFEGMKAARAGMRLNDISRRIGEYGMACGMGVVRELTGHGIGQDMHEDPMIPNYAGIGSGPLLKAGMTMAIEPMFTLGSSRIIWSDEWPVRSFDASPASHYENTILITDGEPEILSQPGDGTGI